MLESYMKSQGWNPAQTDSSDQAFVYDQIFKHEMGDLRFSANNWRQLRDGVNYVRHQTGCLAGGACRTHGPHLRAWSPV